MTADLRVIGSGWGRTGTASLKEALEILGFGPCHHMIEVIGRNMFSDWIGVFRDVKHGGEPKLDDVFKGYKSQCDLPGCLVYEQILRRNPDVKVVHTVRDTPRAWAESARETIAHAITDNYRWLHEMHDAGVPEWAVFWIIKGMGTMFPFMLDVWMGTDVIEIERKRGWRAALDAMKEALSEAKLEAAYVAWNESVRANVDSKNLLVFNVKEGWGPLCKFLGCAIPDVPFPRINERQVFSGHMKTLERYAKFAKAIPTVVAPGIVGLMAIGAVWLTAVALK
ncbi:hypothetical protein DFJ74DRAFT_207965 [Hyaloraphidium curvatum]|nr:hypothetical protein DFJ74DRAFT_207965 [Hyaloraphidium curvatum]